MKETATIFQHATENSFVIEKKFNFNIQVILDEVGRGTSYEDGMSLAYSIVKCMVEDLKCRGIFATHYHDIANVLANSDNKTRISCSTTRIRLNNVSRLVIIR